MKKYLMIVVLGTLVPYAVIGALLALRAALTA